MEELEEFKEEVYIIKKKNYPKKVIGYRIYSSQEAIIKLEQYKREFPTYLLEIVKIK